VKLGGFPDHHGGENIWEGEEGKGVQEGCCLVGKKVWAGSNVQGLYLSLARLHSHFRLTDGELGD